MELTLMRTVTPEWETTTKKIIVEDSRDKNREQEGHRVHANDDGVTVIQRSNGGP